MASSSMPLLVDHLRSEHLRHLLIHAQKVGTLGKATG